MGCGLGVSVHPPSWLGHLSLHVSTEPFLMPSWVPRLRALLCQLTATLLLVFIQSHMDERVFCLSPATPSSPPREEKRSVGLCLLIPGELLSTQVFLGGGETETEWAPG